MTLKESEIKRNYFFFPLFFFLLFYIPFCYFFFQSYCIEKYPRAQKLLPDGVKYRDEISGVNQELLDLCDTSIEIPQYGIKQSLNVAVAYGIAVFDLRRVWDS